MSLQIVRINSLIGGRHSRGSELQFKRWLGVGAAVCP
jgi:hypothetical protein